MKKMISGVVIALMFCVLTVGVAFGKEKSRVVTFGQDFIVGTMTVKAGTYKLTYNDQTNELTFADKKTKEVVAKVKTTTQASDKANTLDMKWAKKGDKEVLVSIQFVGDKQVVVIENSNTDSGL